MEQSTATNSAPTEKKTRKPRQRGRSRRSNVSGTNNSLNNATPEPSGSKEESRRKRPQKRSKNKTDDQRYGEVVKLIKRYIPITVNGLAVSSILHPKPSATESSELEKVPQPKKLSKAEKLAIIAAHLRRVVEKDPEQPLYLSFILIPSDPDFPFELELLNFNITIPVTYPRNPATLPSVLVLNTDIPRGFAVNIERMYADIARLALGGAIDNQDLELVNGKGLLSQIQTLDRNLEHALKQEKRATVKFVSFRQAHASPKPSPLPLPMPTPTSTPAPVSSATEASGSKKDATREAKKATPQRLKKAQDARDLAVERMCAKLASQVRLFHRSATEERYKVQVPVGSGKIPKLWRFENNSVDVFVSIPGEFPESDVKVNVATNFSNNMMVAKRTKLEAAGYSLLKVVEEARTAEKNFRANMAEWLEQVPVKNKEGPLFFVTLINWMANNMQWLLQPKNDYMNWTRLTKRLEASI